MTVYNGNGLLEFFEFIMRVEASEFKLLVE